MTMINVKIDYDDEYIKNTGDIDVIKNAFDEIAKAVKNSTGNNGWIMTTEKRIVGRWEIKWKA